MLCSLMIGICGGGGYPNLAELLFKQQMKAAETDINCQPDTISYRYFSFAINLCTSPVVQLHCE